MSAGCDNLVKAWRYKKETGGWIEEEPLNSHPDWVHGVAWAPNVDL